MNGSFYGYGMKRDPARGAPQFIPKHGLQTQPFGRRASSLERLKFTPGRWTGTRYQWCAASSASPARPATRSSLAAAPRSGLDGLTDRSRRPTAFVRLGTLSRTAARTHACSALPGRACSAPDGKSGERAMPAKRRCKASKDPARLFLFWAVVAGDALVLGACRGGAIPGSLWTAHLPASTMLLFFKSRFNVVRSRIGSAGLWSR